MNWVAILVIIDTAILALIALCAIAIVGYLYWKVKPLFAAKKAAQSMPAPDIFNMLKGMNHV